MSDKVFIAFQNNSEAQPIIEAILEDNASAEANETPGMVK
ncbi:MAG: MmoB/DmpM family protein, partial [Gammaproteobacteria bacterium]